jgi:hypothetical protein
MAEQFYVNTKAFYDQLSQQNIPSASILKHYKQHLGLKLCLPRLPELRTTLQYICDYSADITRAGSEKLLRLKEALVIESVPVMSCIQ